MATRGEWAQFSSMPESWGERNRSFGAIVRAGLLSCLNSISGGSENGLEGEANYRVKDGIGYEDGVETDGGVKCWSL